VRLQNWVSFSSLYFHTVVAGDASVLMHARELLYMAYMLANNILPATFLILIVFVLIPQIVIA